MKKNYLSHPAVREIYEMLDFYLRKMTLGLLPFMDRSIPFPSSKEIADAIKTSKITSDNRTKVMQGRPLPEQQQVIELAEHYIGIIDKYGGEEMRDAFDGGRHSSPSDHAIIWDWSRKGQNDIKTMADIAERHGYNNSSVLYKRRDIFLGKIAFEIFMRFMSKQSKK